MAAVNDVKKARQRIANKKYKSANAAMLRMECKTYYVANKDKIAAQKKAYYAKNRAHLLLKKKEYDEKNKEARKVKQKSWHMANRAYEAACCRARRARKKAIAAGQVPPPMPKLADFGGQDKASPTVAPVTSTDAAGRATELSDADDPIDDVPHPLAATTKKIVMVSFTNEHPFNLRKRGPEPCCDECALFQPNALTSATNTVLLAGTYMCTFCREWTYYRLHRKHKRTRADALMG